MAPGQPHWLGSSIDWGANVARGNLGFYNTAFALIQVAIGLGCCTAGRSSRRCCCRSRGRSSCWWFGEAFGMLFMNNGESAHRRPKAA